MLLDHWSTPEDDHVSQHESPQFSSINISGTQAFNIYLCISWPSFAVVKLEDALEILQRVVKRTVEILRFTLTIGKWGGGGVPTLLSSCR